MDFSISVVDNFSKYTIIEDAGVNFTGLTEILKLFSELDDESRQEFVHSLRDHGERTHVGTDYTITTNVKA